MDARTRQLVRQRADNRCEYCRLPEEADEWPFHIDHIIAKVHEGSDDLANLAWACTQCNLHKGTNFASIDPHTLERVDIFSPRDQQWGDHFVLLEDGRIEGRTSTGRATARLLDFNGSPQLELRRELLDQDEY